MTVNEPLVSIISPTYNHEKFITDCIESVLSQTYTNWEMIIVDDGSTDGTFAITEKYAKKDKRIQVHTQQNIGIFRLGETYNFALSTSNGKYIAVLEGDDIWLPEKLEKQVAVLEQNDKIVLSWGSAMGVSMDLSKDSISLPYLKYNKDILTNTPVKSSLKELLYNNFIPALSVLIRKSSLEQLGGFIQNNNLPLVDLPTWQQLAFLGPFSYIDQTVGKWRISPGQTTKTYTIELLKGIYQLSLQVYLTNVDFFNQNQIYEKSIHHHYQKRLIVNYCRAGNYKIVRKDFSGARKDYILSIKTYGFNKLIWKSRALFGVLESVLFQKISK